MCSFSNSSSNFLTDIVIITYLLFILKFDNIDESIYYIIDITTDYYTGDVFV